MARKKTYDLTNPSVRNQFVSYSEAMELYSMGINKIRLHAEKSGALYKMEQAVLINCEVFESYLENFRMPGNFEEIAKLLVPEPSIIEKGEINDAEN